MAAFWGVAEADLPSSGPSGSELLQSLGSEDGARALLVMGSNLVVSSPDAGSLEKRLATLDFLVVADPFLSETAALADVVLPVCQWAEHEGTMTNLEGRVLHRRPARSPPSGVWTDLQILSALAEKLGRPGLIEAEPELAFDELRRASAGGLADYSGITYSRIRSGESLFWPCPGDGHPGTPTLFLERFATPDGRARFHATPYVGATESPDEQYPLYLTTGRVLAHYQTGTQTRRVESLLLAEPEPFVEIHPALAASFNIAEGDWVALRTRRGRIVVKARLVPSMRLDTVFTPFHWGGLARANILTGTAVDPYSKIPEFKLSAASIEKVPTSPSVPSLPPH
jgi:assimilatory nitrate reductase catalytic subunit